MAGIAITRRELTASQLRAAAGVSRGKRPRQGPPHATRPCGHRNTSAARAGDDGEGPARHRSEGGPERYHRRSRVETKMRLP